MGTSTRAHRPRVVRGAVTPASASTRLPPRAWLPVTDLGLPPGCVRSPGAANVLLLRNSLQLRAKADVSTSEVLSLVAAKLLESTSEAVSARPRQCRDLGPQTCGTGV